MPDHDAIFEPDLSDLGSVVRSLSVEAALIIDEPDESYVDSWRELIAEIRFSTSRSFLRQSTPLEPGIYGVKTRGNWRLVIRQGVAEEILQARSASLSRLTNDNDPLVIASDLLQDHWEHASPLTDEGVFPAGTNVRVLGTNDFGRIVSHRRLPEMVQYTVDVRGVYKTISANQLQELSGDLNDPHVWMSVPPSSAGEIALTVAWTKLRNPLTDVLYSFQASRTLFRPYQFKPVLKMIQSEDHRLLVADEVGLGKTIEAGLIWSELEGRNPLDRVLVLCPAALTVKWQTEMELRFARKLRLLGRGDWDGFFESVEKGDHAPILGVDSIERLRMTDVPAKLIESGVRFDLVIIDEAHKMRNASNRTHTLGTALADATDALVLLTATPVNLRNRDLYTLLGLLDEGRFNDPALFELESIPNACINRAAALLLDPDATPMSIRDMLLTLGESDFGATVLDRPDARQLLSLLNTESRLTAAQTGLARRMLAGLGTFAPYMSRTRKVEVPDAKAVRSAHTLKVVWTPQEQEFYDAVRAWVGGNARATGTPPGFAEQMPLRQTASCIPAMAERIRMKRSADWDTDYAAEVGGEPSEPSIIPELNVAIPTVDSKLAVFLESLVLIREAGLKQAMVFSYFRLTLAYLDGKLRDAGYTTRVMHGGIALDDREQIMRDFRAGAFEILLMSEVGSEGLDFEFCGALINYDLPWNPMRVEQRIGRLDRFGQKHEKVLIYNFSVDGTIEDRILLRLYERIGVFEESIGELEPIISDEIDDLANLLADVRLTPAEQELRAQQIEVALAEKEHQIEQLRANEGSLTQLDKVLIDGFEEHNPGRGRFVGEQELTLILSDLATRTAGKVVPNAGGQVVTLTGTPKLAAKMRDHLRRESHPNPGSLIQRVQDSNPVELALVPSAADGGRQLVSVRHPLIRIAVDEIHSDPIGLKRFGHLSLSDNPSSQYLAVLSVVEGTGVRSFLRLEPIVVGLDGNPAPDLADELLQSFATGLIQAAKLPVPGNLADLYETAQRLADLSRIESEQHLQLYNDSLVASRRAALLHSAQIKIAAAQRMLDSTSESRITRMQQGRIRNVRENCATKVQELESSTAMVSATRIAVVLIDR